MERSRIRRVALLASLAGVAGILALSWTHGAGLRWGVGPGLRTLASLSILAIAVGPALALALLLSPDAGGLRLRHFVAGSTAAWLAYELASVVQRSGLPQNSDAFRGLYGPFVEELLKATMLASVWTLTDDSRERAPLASAAVGVSVGFAMRENYIYLAGMFVNGEAQLLGAVMRAVPPVLAHGLFGAILGSTVAQGAVHARACGLPPSRVSLLGLALAVGGHMTFNGVALLLGRFLPDHAYEFSLAWSLLVGVGWYLSAVRTRELAAQDEPLRASALPSPEPSRSPLLALPLVVLALWLVPLAATHLFALELTPLALAILAAVAASWRLRGALAPRRVALQELLAAPLRAVTVLCLGIACRPILWAAGLSEAALAQAIHVNRRGALAHVLLACVSNGAWALTVGALLRGAGATSRPREALRFALFLAAGLAGSSAGGQLALGPAPRVSAMLWLTLALVPRALGEAGLQALLVARAGSRWVAASVAWALFVSALQLLPSMSRGARWGTLLSAALSLGMMLLARRLAAREEGRGSELAS